MATSQVGASVDLELRVNPSTVPVGGPVDVELMAIWDGQGDSTVSSIDVILKWNADVLLFQGIRAPVPAPIPGQLFDDSDQDGLNDSLVDGDAFFQAQSLSGVVVPVEGLLVTTFEFTAVAPGKADVELPASAECTPRSLRCISGDNFGLSCVDDTDCGVRRCAGGTNHTMPCTSDEACPGGTCPVLCTGCSPRFCCTTQIRCTSCSVAETGVFGTGAANQNVTGELRSTSVTAAVDISLWVSDLVIPSDSTAPVVVSGAIFGESAFGVEVAVQLVPRQNATGTVMFTPVFSPADVDVMSLSDPWQGVGHFQPFDTDQTESELQNASVADNGNLGGTATPTMFVGPLTAFPIVSSPDARGVWDVLLAADFQSMWDGTGLAQTDLSPGVVVVVAPHDADGSETVDLRDAAAFQRCFTGRVGPVDPPAYSLDPTFRCRVVDTDGDGDVDDDDLVSFIGAMLGP